SRLAIRPCGWNGRDSLAAYLTRIHGCPIESERVAVVSAGISGLMLAAQVILSPGDKVVAVTPLWPNVVEIPRILGAGVTRVPLAVRDGRRSLDLDRLLAALTPGTRALVVNSPNNPTGWTITEEAIDAVLAHCRRHGIWIFADDVYQRLPYDPDVAGAPSFLTRYRPGDRIISVNSFSKAWLMTGFRIGWIVVPPDIVDTFVKLIEYNTACVPEPSQRAADAALRGGEPVIASLRAHLRRTRAILAEGLGAHEGVELPEAGGGMYGFFRIAGYEDAVTLTRRLVDEVGLGLAPGNAFGLEGRGWLRWCHAASEDKLRDGLGRLARFLALSRQA
ncbi:pyridoxal phosphate-dependent aminotransferase, partial [Methylobacterium frigidaeris]|uniref:pyridoxal phosphate-dependent aminotransferase n=1 Tax=Methylobacterium frigidaeris TaxID=2038277 RepID=UPI000C19E216